MEYWNLGLVNSLLKGFWRGDGSRSFQSFLVSSTSLDLIEKIRIILIRNYILPYYEIRTVDKHKSSVINGKIVKAKHNLYNLVCYGINGEKFANIIDEKYISRSKRQLVHFKTINNVEYICYPIDKISQKSVKDVAVYNLEVKGSHSYHAGRVAAHNCWCEPGHDNTCGRRFKWQLGKLPFGYDHKYIYSHIGYNLKITDMQAAIGVAQLEKLNKFIEARKRNFTYLYNHLKKYEQYFILPRASQYSDPSWFGFPLLVKEAAPFSRNEIVEYLEKNKIATRMLFGGNLMRQPAYTNIKCRIPLGLKNTDLVMNNLFWLGVYPGITKQMLAYIVAKIKAFLKARI
ncbi:MAG: DegT/DnrJ/EryC1/StrS family aminotransferase [Candidatus Omnitrophota bacterium]|nr:DegT/DnrJ/EryC1/StrS family aminotransferase [Candidatus Omnitrophota bacterium]